MAELTREELTRRGLEAFKNSKPWINTEQDKRLDEVSKGTEHLVPYWAKNFKDPLTTSYYEKVDTLKAEYPVFAKNIDAVRAKGYSDAQIRAYLSRQEFINRAYYSHDTIEKMYDRTAESWNDYWEAMNAQKDAAYVKILKHKMPEERIRDIVKTARINSMSPALLFRSPALLKKAEEMTGERLGTLEHLIASIGNAISNTNSISVGSEKFIAESSQQEIKRLEKILSEGSELEPENGALVPIGARAIENEDERREFVRNNIQQRIETLKKQVQTWSDWQKADEADAQRWYTNIRPTDSAIGAFLYSAIENSGTTILSAIRSGIGWGLGGVAGGMLASAFNTWDESTGEAGRVLIEGLKRGMSDTEAYNAARQDYYGNLAYLGISNFGGDVFRFGLGHVRGLLAQHGKNAIVSRLDKWLGYASGLPDKLAGKITGDKIFHKVLRGAVKYGLPEVLEAIPEGGEEVFQDWYSAYVLGDKVKAEELWSSFWGGVGQSFIYSLAGKGTGKVIDKITGADARKKAQEDIARVIQEVQKTVQESNKLEAGLNDGTIKADDIVAEDPVVFLPRASLTEQVREQLGLNDETTEVLSDKDELTTSEAAQIDAESTGEVQKVQAGNSQAENQQDDEVAVRQSVWDEFKKEHPEEAAALEPNLRTGVKGVTAAERLAQIQEFLNLDMPTVEAQQVRDIVSQVQNDWKNLRGEVGFNISDEVIEAESTIYGHYLLSCYAEYGFTSPGEFHEFKLQNGDNPVENVLNQLMHHGEWAATEFKAYGIHMSENADSVTVGENGQNAGAVKNIEGPEQSELIDYHESMNSQPEGVRAKIQTLINDLKAAGFNTDGLSDGDIPGKTFYVRLKAITKLKAYRDYAQTDNKHADQLASELLGRYGIPGMSYWHEKATKKKAGVRNFIIWDTSSFRNAQAESVQAENVQAENNIEGVVEPEIEPEMSEVIENEPEIVEVESENKSVSEPETESRTVVIIDDAQGAVFVENDLYDELVELVAAEVEKSRRNITISAILRDYELRNEIEAALNEEQEAAAEIINTVASEAENPQVSTRRGYIDLSDPKKVVLGLTKNADASTFLHEIWHMALGDLLRYGTRKAASEQVKADRETAMDWLGITEADFDNPERMRTAQEDWARAGEAYFMTGKAPTKQLQGVFQRIRAWMLEIYDGIKASLKLNRELTDEIREVFDRMLALEEDITEANAAESNITVGQSRHEAEQISARVRELEAEIRANGDNIPEETAAAEAADYQATTEIYNQIIGEKGAANLDEYDKQNRIENLGVAREMEAAGKDAKTIRLATGWERGADGKWKYWIPDGKIRPKKEWGKETSTFLGVVYDAPELYRAYPELQYIVFLLKDDLPEGMDGQFSSNLLFKTLSVRRGVDNKKLKSIIVHEVQHAIQEIEGFAKGGVPAMIDQDTEAKAFIWGWCIALKNYAEEHHELTNKAEIGRLLEEDLKSQGEDIDGIPEELRQKALDFYIHGYSEAEAEEYERAFNKYQEYLANEENGNSFENYEKFAGEVEARNAQYLSGKKKISGLLADTEDVAREDQIIFFDDSGGNNQASYNQDITADVAENIRRGTEAMNKVISEQTDVINAMYREDVGYISFIWGTPGTGKKFKGGKGIAHIIARRNEQGYDGQAIARKLVEVIAKGDAVNLRGNPGGERIDIIYGGYTAVLSLYNDGQRQTWLLTGWEDYKNTSVASSEGDGSSGATLNRPMLARPDEGAEVLSQSLAEDTAEVNGENESTPEWLDAEAARDVEDWLKAWGDYEVRRDEYQNLREGIRLIKELGGLRFQDFVNVLGRELAVDLRSQWSGLFRNIQGKIKLPLDQLMQPLEAEGLRFEYADDFINWLENAAKQQPKRPLPLVAINEKTLDALIHEIGFDGAKDYIDQRRRYLKALQRKIQAEYDKDKSNAQVRADLEATYKEQREISEQLKRFDWAFAESEADIPEWLADTSWLDENDNDNQAEARKRRKQPETLTLSEAFKKGYELAEKYSREAYKAGVKAGREAQRTKDAERIADLKETQKERIAALKAKYKQLQAREKAKKALNAFIDKMVNDVKEAINDKKVIWHVQQEIKKELEKIDLKHRSKQALERQHDVEFLLESIGKTPETLTQEDMDTLGITAKDLKNLGKSSIDEMTIAELYKLHEKIQELREQGRRELEVKNLLNKERINKMREELWRPLLEKLAKRPRGAVKSRKDLDKIYAKGIKGAAQRALDYINTRTLGANRFFDWLDGGKGAYTGAWVRYFVDAINDAQNEKLRHVFERREWIEARMQELGLKAADLAQGRKVDIPDISSEPWTVDRLMSIYAGMKNEKSHAAILYGNFAQAKSFVDLTQAKTEEEQQELIYDKANEWAAKCVQALTDKEKAFADAIIEEYEMHFERINNALIDVYNRGMSHEENYTPMRRLEVNAYGNISTPDTAQTMLDDSYTVQAGGGSKTGDLGHVGRGFAKERIKNLRADAQASIDLGLFNIWNTQMEAQEHAAAFVRPVQDMRKILTGRNKNKQEMTIQKAVKLVHGKDAWAFIRNYFNIAAQDQTLLAHDVLDGVFGWLAKNASRAYLCANAGTALKQTTSFPRFLPYCGLTHMLKAIGEFAADHKKFINECYALDPQLKARSGNVILQSMRASAELGKYGEILDMGMKPIQWMDKGASIIGWKAVYDANIAKGKSQQEAVRAAQRAVALTQQTIHVKDAPLLWQQGGLVRLAMIFSSDTAQTFGISIYDLAASIRAGNAPKFLSTILSVTLAATMMGLLTKGGPDDDDWDSLSGWLEFMGSSLARQTVETIPLLGKGLVNLWDSKGYSTGEQSAYLAPFARIISAGSKLWDAKSDNNEDAFFNLMEAGALFAPFPATAVRRLWRVGGDVARGEFWDGFKHSIGLRREFKKTRRRLSR